VSGLIRFRYYPIGLSGTGRNTFTSWLWGESSGVNGQTYPETGYLTRMRVIGEVTSYTSGSGTLTVTLYKDGTTGSDDVFTFTSASLGSVAPFVGEITTAGSKSVDFGTNSKFAVSVVMTGSSPLMTVGFTILVESILNG